MTKTFEMPDYSRTQIGCFKVGHKVVRGNGRKIMTITRFEVWKNGSVFARLNKGVTYRLDEISLAGPNSTLR